MFLEVLDHNPLPRTFQTKRRRLFLLDIHRSRVRLGSCNQNLDIPFEERKISNFRRKCIQSTKKFIFFSVLYLIQNTNSKGHGAISVFWDSSFEVVPSCLLPDLIPLAEGHWGTQEFNSRQNVCPIPQVLSLLKLLQLLGTHSPVTVHNS